MRLLDSLAVGRGGCSARLAPGVTSPTPRTSRARAASLLLGNLDRPVQQSAAVRGLGGVGADRRSCWAGGPKPAPPGRPDRRQAKRGADAPDTGGRARAKPLPDPRRIGIDPASVLVATMLTTAGSEPDNNIVQMEPDQESTMRCRPIPPIASLPSGATRHRAGCPFPPLSGMYSMK